MIWVDRIVKQLQKRALPLEWVDDMKTPSGRIHVGALRGVVIHDMVHKVLTETGTNSRFSYVFNDFDQMDAIPSYLDKNTWQQYSGMPLFRIPSPEKEHDNFARFYADEFISVFTAINCHPEILWSSELYLSGKMNPVIIEALNKADIIRDIYRTVTKADRPDDWHPFQAVCESCGKIGTTYVYRWDGERVFYRCEPKQAAWAVGCGHEGAVSPLNGTGTLHWKVDWPAHWKVIGVTFEGSGKDHMSSGGSYDVAKEICNKVFNIKPPVAVAYEWFTVGGKKMSSSKGIGSSAKETAEILPPDILRFLIVRSPIEAHLDFNPFGNTIPDIYDDFDRCMNAYFTTLEGTLPEGKKGKVIADFARIIELSAVSELPKKRLFLPRFRTIVNALRSNVDIGALMKQQKGSKLTDEERAVLDERLTVAQIYRARFAPKEHVSDHTPSGKPMTETQSAFIASLGQSLSKLENPDKDSIQNTCFEILKTGGYKARDVFPPLYTLLTGKPYGPKIADIILEKGIKESLKILNKAINLQK